MGGEIVDFEFDNIDTAKCATESCGSRGRQIPAELGLMIAQIRWAIFEADLEWINDDSDRDYVFSFRSCCDVLGLDCDATRNVLNDRIGKKGFRVYAPKPRTALEPRSRRRPGKDLLASLRGVPRGVKCSRCPECRSRYNFAYGRYWRRSSRSRTPVTARLSVVT